MERLKPTIQRAGLVALLSFNAACVEGSNQQIREAKTDSRPLEQPVNLPEPEYILVREEIPTPQIIWPTSTPEPSLTPTLTPKPTLTSTPARTPTKIPTPTLTPSPTSTPKLLPTATSVKEAEAPVPVLITRGNQNRKRISATFDCGSADQNLAPILQALRERGVKTTFFITGEFARKYPASLKQIAADGHEVGNHSNTHPDFTPLSNEGMIDQLKNAEKSISSITGKSTKPWMRFPYGAYNGHTLRIVYEAGYRAVGWTIDSGDWHEDWSAQTVRDNYLRAEKINGAIIVGHCHSWQSAQVLGNVLQIWIGQGIEVVPISQVIQ